MLEAISFAEHITKADLVLTGEGKSDSQTLSGKTPFGIAKVANRNGKPIILISGVIDDESRELLVPLFTELHVVADVTISSKESIDHARYYLRLKTKKVMENYLAYYK